MNVLTPFPGIPDDRSGEVPRAYVVKADDNLEEVDVKVWFNYKCKRCQPQIIQDFVASSLSKHKHLAGGVEFVKEIPKSASGKILRKDLKASYNK